MATFKGFYVKMSDFRRFALASVDFSGTLCAFFWHILTGFEVYFTLSTPYMDLGADFRRYRRFRGHYYLLHEIKTMACTYV